MKLEVTNLSKRFDNRPVFSNLNFSISSPGSLAIVGPNGSGKTTLLKLLAGLLRPTSGTVTLSADGGPLKQSDLHQFLKLISPTLALYDDLTGLENLRFFGALAGIRLRDSEFAERLGAVGLPGRGGDRVSTYSSGMKQRLKYAVALLSTPPLLLVDEPTTNLDDDGKQIVAGLLRRQREHALLVIATNEREDLDAADQVIDLAN
jgi:heme exporter protein A